MDVVCGFFLAYGNVVLNRLNRIDVYNCTQLFGILPKCKRLMRNSLYLVPCMVDIN